MTPRSGTSGQVVPIRPFDHPRTYGDSKKYSLMTVAGMRDAEEQELVAKLKAKYSNIAGGAISNVRSLSEIVLRINIRVHES